MNLLSTTISLSFILVPFAASSTLDSLKPTTPSPEEPSFALIPTKDLRPRAPMLSQQRTPSQEKQSFVFIPFAPSSTVDLRPQVPVPVLKQRIPSQAELCCERMGGIHKTVHNFYVEEQVTTCAYKGEEYQEDLFLDSFCNGVASPIAAAYSNCTGTNTNDGLSCCLDTFQLHRDEICGTSRDCHEMNTVLFLSCENECVETCQEICNEDNTECFAECDGDYLQRNLRGGANNNSTDCRGACSNDYRTCNNRCNDECIVDMP